MRIELEIKIPVASLESLESSLSILGAKLLSDEEQVDVYFQHPCRDLASTDEALRVRRVNGAVWLTYKGPKIGTAYKVRREEEVMVSSFESIISLLQLLGFREVAVLKKRRMVYEVERLRVYLDHVEGLGSFVEVEALITEDEERTMLEAELRELAERLNLPLEKATTKSYLELYLEKGGVG